MTVGEAILHYRAGGVYVENAGWQGPTREQVDFQLSQCHSGGGCRATWKSKKMLPVQAKGSFPWHTMKFLNSLLTLFASGYPGSTSQHCLIAKHISQAVTDHLRGKCIASATDSTFTN